MPTVDQIFRITTAALTVIFCAGASIAASVSSLSSLSSITFYERTGGSEPTPYTFSVGGPELTTMLADPLGALTSDFGGATSEYYDVFYSDAEGNFSLLGEYLTISGVFEFGLPNGGGLNLAEIGLNFLDSSIEFGNYVASFEAYGDNALPGSVGNAIDGDLLTHTTMGNTSETDSRLRLTLGFLSSSGPPPEVIPLPAAVILLLSGFVFLSIFSKRRG